MPVTDDFGNSAETPVPAWFLAPYEETEIRKRCQDQAQEECKTQFIKFGECAQNHQLLFPWKCADLKKELLDCVAYWGANDKFEDLRVEFIMEKKRKLAEEGKV
ncbi:hypothetical protein B9G98_00188 [Wickerhamiella sorbophila]|uniref:COX assembly mitochondrial protein n=1 Tax=Wickerhamiella sorbophila TaxID=45607 RepID=A0A2T0FC41_9ASCO|nr:hypothetical protein B9G98_00188 [Wickerhamiella sorbophila]PRT52568.1 hypothetical protein B9G98_00188 [Wickerhamiella sorbophila]